MDRKNATCLCKRKMMYFFRNYEWGFPGMGPGGPGGIVPGMAGAGAGGPPAIPSSVAPTTADVIAQQSQVISFFIYVWFSQQGLTFQPFKFNILCISL